MNVKTTIKIGADQFEVSQDVKDQTEFFEFSAFFSSIPKVGPDGETDLKLVHRTPKGYNYYSIVSEKAQKEYKFGQSKENPGTLFGKGWEPLYTKEGAQQSTNAGSPVNVGGAAVAQAPVAAPQQTITPVAAPVQTPTPVQAPVATAAVPQAVAPGAAAAPATKSAQANDVLARFGINTAK